MTFGSTSANINLLSLITSILTILGIFYFDFTAIYVAISIVSFYTLNILGNWLMLHRYYAHKSFEFKYDLIRKILTLLCILSGRGSPLGWTYIHRQHHAYSDTEKDPHSPKHLGFKLFGFGHYKNMESEKMKMFLVKDILNKEQLFIHKYYILLLFVLVLPIILYDLKLAYFIWILPVSIVHISQNMFNYFGHTYGYKNFTSKDDSRNNPWLFPLILGEAWHNNHHSYPKNHTTKSKVYEVDPLANVIDLLKK